jgi:hypothetical protein
MTNEFDWNDSDLTMKRGYGDLAIYANSAGDIVLRQRDTFGGDDAVVIVPRHLASWAVAAIEAELKMVHDDIQSGRVAGEQQ